MTDFNLNNYLAEVGSGFGKSVHSSVIFRRHVTWRDGGGGAIPISPSSLFSEMIDLESDFKLSSTGGTNLVASSWADIDQKSLYKGFTNQASDGPSIVSSVAPKNKPGLLFNGLTSGVSATITDVSAASGSFWVAVCVSAPNVPFAGVVSSCLLDCRTNTNFGVRLYLASGSSNLVVWSPSSNLNYVMTSAATSSLIAGLGVAEFIFDEPNNEISFWWNGVNYGVQRNSSFSACNFITSATAIGNLMTGSWPLKHLVFATFIAPYAPTVAHRKRLLSYWDAKYLTGLKVTR